MTFCRGELPDQVSSASCPLGILVRGLGGPVVAGIQQRRWAPSSVLDVEVAVPAIDVSPSVVALDRLSGTVNSERNEE